MPSWTSPEFVLTNADVSSMRWLSLRYGAIASRACSIALSVGFYGSVGVGMISVIASAITGNVSAASVIWVYIVGACVANWWRSRRKVDRSAPVTRDIASTVTVDEFGIRLTHADGTYSYSDWKRITYSTATRAGVYVIDADILCFMIPARCFRGRQEMDQVAILVNDLRRAACTSHVAPRARDFARPERAPDAAFTLDRTLAASFLRSSRLKSPMIGLVFFTMLAGIAGILLRPSSGDVYKAMADYSLIVFVTVCAAAYPAQVYDAWLRIAWSIGNRWNIWAEPEHCVFASDNRHSVASWSVIEKADVAGDIVSLTFKGGIVQAIPISAWGQRAGAAEFVARVNEHRAAGSKSTEPVPSDLWPPPPQRIS